MPWMLLAMAAGRLLRFLIIYITMVSGRSLTRSVYRAATAPEANDLGEELGEDIGDDFSEDLANDPGNDLGKDR